MRSMTLQGIFYLPEKLKLEESKKAKKQVKSIFYSKIFNDHFISNLHFKIYLINRTILFSLCYCQKTIEKWNNADFFQTWDNMTWNTWRKMNLLPYLRKKMLKRSNPRNRALNLALKIMKRAKYVFSMKFLCKVSK